MSEDYEGPFGGHKSSEMIIEGPEGIKDGRSVARRVPWAGVVIRVRGVMRGWTHSSVSASESNGRGGGGGGCLPH